MSAPPRLETLWEVIERYAHMAASASGGLADMERRIVEWRHNHPSDVYVETTDYLLLCARMAEHRVRQAVTHSGLLSDVQGQLDRLKGKLDLPIAIEELNFEIGALRSRLADILKNDFLFHLDPDDVPIYQSEQPFGDLVGKKFPKTIEDASEAAKCLALQRSTACVFHLMRVMEAGVKALGRKLKVSVNVEAECWYDIVNHIDKAIKALPAQTAAQQRRKAALAAAAANLNAVRIATRNQVMHPKETYSREEARRVFDTTRAFMVHLAALV